MFIENKMSTGLMKRNYECDCIKLTRTKCVSLDNAISFMIIDFKLYY